jgi:hypothetical protein
VNEIDRILSSEAQGGPSGEFTDRVMRAVRREARAPAPIRFPWRRLAAAVVACGALGFAACVWLPAGALSTAPLTWTAAITGGGLVSASLAKWSLFVHA